MTIASSNLDARLCRVVIARCRSALTGVVDADLATVGVRITGQPPTSQVRVGLTVSLHGRTIQAVGYAPAPEYAIVNAALELRRRLASPLGTGSPCRGHTPAERSNASRTPAQSAPGPRRRTFFTLPTLDA